MLPQDEFAQQPSVEVDESALEKLGSVVATALGRYLDVALASGRGINTSVLQELQRARLPSRPVAPVQNDERRVDCLLDELCIQHRDDLCRIASRSTEALDVLETQKQELLNRVFAIEERHAALESLDLPAIEATLSHSHSLVVSLQARGEDLALRLAYEGEQRAAAVEEVRYCCRRALVPRLPRRALILAGAADDQLPIPCALRPSPSTRETFPSPLCTQARVLRLKNDGLLLRVQSSVESAASLHADVQRAQESHEAELARAHQVQQQIADAVYTLRRARKQDQVELALLAAELRRADDTRADDGTTASILRGTEDPTLGPEPGHAGVSRLRHGELAPGKVSSGLSCLPDVADDSDATCMSISVADGDSHGIQLEEMEDVSRHPSVANASPALPAAAGAVVDIVNTLEASSHRAPAAPRAPDVAPAASAGGHTLLARRSKPDATMMPIALHHPPTALRHPPTSKPATIPTQRIRAAAAPPPSRPLLQRGNPNACLAPSPLRCSSEHDTGTTGSRSTVGSSSPAAGVLAGELAPDIMRAVAAFGLGDAIARLHQPLNYGGRMASVLPSLQPALRRSDCAVSPISVISSPLPESWYMQETNVQAQPPKELAARAPPPRVAPAECPSPNVLAHRKRKHAPRIMDVPGPDRQSPTPPCSPPRHVASAKLRRQTPRPHSTAPLQQQCNSEPMHLGEDKQTKGGYEQDHTGNARASVHDAPLRKEARRSHPLANMLSPRKHSSARRVLDLFGDDF